MFGISTSSADTARDRIHDYTRHESNRLLEKTKWQNMIDEYNDLRQIIKSLEGPVANVAKELLAVLKSTILDAETGVVGCLDTNMIHDVLIKTKKLLTTPAVTIDNQVNQAFTQCANEYAASMTKMKKQVRQNVLGGIGMILLATLILAGTAAAAVFTLGLPVAPFAITAVVCAFGSASGIMSSLSGINFFKKAYFQHQVTNKMENLATSLRI